AAGDSSGGIEPPEERWLGQARTAAARRIWTAAADHPGPAGRNAVRADRIAADAIARVLRTGGNVPLRWSRWRAPAGDAAGNAGLLLAEAARWRNRHRRPTVAAMALGVRRCRPAPPAPALGRNRRAKALAADRKPALVLRPGQPPVGTCRPGRRPRRTAASGTSPAPGPCRARGQRLAGAAGTGRHPRTADAGKPAAHRDLHARARADPGLAVV